jgi:pimeloyl-ACP methyl ester carboxylesterase
MNAKLETTSAVTVEACPLHYTVHGEGPMVLMIQGVGVHGRGWSPQVEALAPRYTCVTFDNRGLGRSVPRGAPISVERMAADALAVLDAATRSRAALGAAPGDAVHVIGHSLGGLVAVQLALDAPRRVASLTLLCTFAAGRSVAPLTARMAWLGMRARVGTRRMRRRGFLGLVQPPGRTYDSEREAAKFAHLFGHDLADTPVAGEEQLRALRRADTTPRLAELAGIPTLIVAAQHDPIAPPSIGRALLGIPGARFVEIGDASHGLPITHADEVNALVGEHLTARCAALRSASRNVLVDRPMRTTT